MAPNLQPDIPEATIGSEGTSSGPDAVDEGGAPKDEGPLPPLKEVDGKIDAEAQNQGSLLGSKIGTSIKSLEEMRSERLQDTRTNPFVVTVAVAAALGGLIFGYDIGGAGKLQRLKET